MKAGRDDALFKKKGERDERDQEEEGEMEEISSTRLEIKAPISNELNTRKQVEPTLSRKKSRQKKLKKSMKNLSPKFLNLLSHEQIEEGLKFFSNTNKNN